MSNRQTKETFQSLENRTQLEKKLKILYFVAMIVHIISFVMGIIGMLYIFWEIYEASDVTKHDPSVTVPLLVTKENMQIVIFCFCGFLLQRPTDWLVRFSENPNQFFKNECKPVLKYKPIRWYIFWGGLSLVVYVTVNSLKENHQAFVLLSESFLQIFAPTFFLCILCIAILQYYKKLIVHKEN